jgi:hypothetical protein
MSASISQHQFLLCSRPSTAIAMLPSNAMKNTSLQFVRKIDRRTTAGARGRSSSVKF